MSIHQRLEVPELADSVREEIRDGMRIIWDAPIVMDDGVVLRADVFLPIEEGRYPTIMSYGPYGKGLAFQEKYATAWEIMIKEFPDVARNSSNKYQNWEVVDPEKWVPDGYSCVRVDSRGAGRSPGYMDLHSPRETFAIQARNSFCGTRMSGLWRAHAGPSCVSSPRPCPWPTALQPER